MSLEIQPNIQHSQNTQKSQNSKYARGLAVGALATGGMIGGALAINAFIHSRTIIPISRLMYNETPKIGLSAVYGAIVGGCIGDILYFGTGKCKTFKIYTDIRMGMVAGAILGALANAAANALASYTTIVISGH